jgi:putative Mg2+ transporter-C (MgtC) family protein
MDWLSPEVQSPAFIAAVLLRISLATVLGGVVGWEREASHKAAGLRTHMLIAIGAAAFTLAALDMHAHGRETGGVGDPTRILQGIVQGVGFLGAGQVIQSRGSVQGVTTAVGIWVVGAVGVACGAGFYVLATMVTAFTFVVLHGVSFIEQRFIPRGPVASRQPDAGRDR